MDLTKLSELIENTFKEALLLPIYRFGLPTKKGRSNKVASYGLFDSIEAIPTNDGIYVFMNKYGKYLQGGKNPGKYVPLDPLERWVIKRGIVFTDKNGKPHSPRAMAAIISKHIHRWGIPSDPPWMDEAILMLERNEDIAKILGDLTVDELLQKLEGI